MNTVHSMILSLFVAMSGVACSAQDTAIPFRQIERDAQLSAKLAMPNNAARSRPVFLRIAPWIVFRFRLCGASSHG